MFKRQLWLNVCHLTLATLSAHGMRTAAHMLCPHDACRAVGVCTQLHNFVNQTMGRFVAKHDCSMHPVLSMSGLHPQGTHMTVQMMELLPWQVRPGRRCSGRGQT